MQARLPVVGTFQGVVDDEAVLADGRKWRAG